MNGRHPHWSPITCQAPGCHPATPWLFSRYLICKSINDQLSAVLMNHKALWTKQICTFQIWLFLSFFSFTIHFFQNGTFQCEHAYILRCISFYFPYISVCTFKSFYVMPETHNLRIEFKLIILLSLQLIIFFCSPYEISRLCILDIQYYRVCWLGCH